MQTLPLRLMPGDDLRVALEAIARDRGLHAAFVLQGIGSLSVARIRYAGIDEPAELHGDFEILTLAGSLSPGGAHLHIAVSDASGGVIGGHVAAGCVVRNDGRNPARRPARLSLFREPDPQTGFAELVVQPRI